MASETPERCPTCATAVPAGAPRCPGCGRVFGEENRCPHCHAVAAVIERGEKTVCAACGKPRAGSVVLGGGRSDAGSILPKSLGGREASTAAMVARARGRTQRGFGILALSAGVLAAALAAMIVPGTLGIGLALVGGLVGVGLGAVSIRAGAKNMEKARSENTRAREMAVLELAREEGGRLTATRTAEALGIGVEEADALLTSMVGDGSRVDVEVNSEGVVFFVFRELRRSMPQVRVGQVEADGDAPLDAVVEEGVEEPAEEGVDSVARRRRSDA